MKRLLLPLLAALALPTAVNAETWYLLLRGPNGAVLSVPIGEQLECEVEGTRAINNKMWEGKFSGSLAFVCVKGK